MGLFQIKFSGWVPRMNFSEILRKGRLWPLLWYKGMKNFLICTLSKIWLFEISPPYRKERKGFRAVIGPARNPKPGGPVGPEVSRPARPVFVFAKAWPGPKLNEARRAGSGLWQLAFLLATLKKFKQYHQNSQISQIWQTFSIVCAHHFQIEQLLVKINSQSNWDFKISQIS